MHSCLFPFFPFPVCWFGSSVRRAVLFVMQNGNYWMLYSQNHIVHSNHRCQTLQGGIMPLCWSFPFYLVWLKVTAIFNCASIMNDFFFCFQVAKRETFGNVHPISSVWSTHWSVMDFQTAPIAWMRKTAVSTFMNFLTEVFILNIICLTSI